MPSATHASAPGSIGALAKYEPVIGLEVHVQLLTKSKIFCACSTRFGDAANSNTCPVCLGLPGALPLLNRHALELAIRAALALNLEVQPVSQFARKNYFYPDLPKGYQISQYDLPLACNGWIDIEEGGTRRRIGITRLHMEEDAAKTVHEGFTDSATRTYIDYNRGGMPLIEIVSEPDMRSPSEAYAYLNALKQTLLYTEVSDCNMDEGSLRCDANVSVRLRRAPDFGSKVEVKNLNSFRYLRHALEYEIERQVEAIERAETIEQETRLWNARQRCTEPMRSKEFAHDYRYFPEPDLLPVRVTPQMLATLKSEMPVLPEALRTRFASQYALSSYDIGVLTETRDLATFFEATVKAGALPKSAANWIAIELLRLLNETHREISASPIAPSALASLIAEVESGNITATSGKKVFATMFETGAPAQEIIAQEDVRTVSNSGEIERVCLDVVAKSPENVAKFRTGNEGVLKFFIGQVMKATRGQANPQIVNETLRRMLNPEAK